MKKSTLPFIIAAMAFSGGGCSTSDGIAADLGATSESLQSDPVTAGEPQADSADSTTDDDMTIVFEDNFEGTSRIPDTDKWVLAEKGSSDWARYLSESYDQAYQENGYLYLVGELVDGEYQTAGIETRGKFEFEHGKVECRARFLRCPKGGHSGIWMMPAPPALTWPKSGEIDIMEHLNDEAVIYETAHSWYADDMGHKDDPQSHIAVDVDREDWNIYGLEWTPDELIYTVNGEKHLTYPNLRLGGETGDYQWPFNHPFYIILSQSLGGEGTWAGPIDDAELPAIFQIDWIRVSQKDQSTNGVPKISVD